MKYRTQFVYCLLTLINSIVSKSWNCKGLSTLAPGIGNRSQNQRQNLLFKTLFAGKKYFLRCRKKSLKIFCAAILPVYQISLVQGFFFLHHCKISFTWIVLIYSFPFCANKCSKYFLPTWSLILQIQGQDQGTKTVVTCLKIVESVWFFWWKDLKDGFKFWNTFCCPQVNQLRAVTSWTFRGLFFCTGGSIKLYFETMDHIILYFNDKIVLQQYAHIKKSVLLLMLSSEALTLFKCYLDLFEGCTVYRIINHT